MQHIDTIAATVGATATVIILLFGDNLAKKVLGDEWGANTTAQFVKKSRWIIVILLVLVGAIWLEGRIWRPTAEDFKFRVGMVEAAKPREQAYINVVREALITALAREEIGDQDHGVTVNVVIRAANARSTTPVAGNSTEGSAQVEASLGVLGSPDYKHIVLTKSAPGAYDDNAIQNALGAAAGALAAKLKLKQFDAS